MRNLSVYLVAIICILILLGCKDQADEILPIPIPYKVEKELLTELNLVRQSGCRCGSEQMPPVPLLSVDSLLSKTAEGHARDMYERNYFDHKSPEGLTALARAKKQNYQGSEVGEVIAKNFTSVNSVMKGWLESEPHCRAIMAQNFTEMGAARVGNYWVINFGKP